MGQLQEAIGQLINQHQMSERRACRLVGLSRDSYRNAPEASAQTEALKSKIVEIAYARRRFGYRRVHDLLRLEFPGVNHKRVYRLYSDANLAVRKRKKARRPPAERMGLNIATRVNEVWSMDFVSDSLANGRRLKVIVRPAPFLRDLRVVARMPAEQVHACGMVCTNRRWCTPWRDRRARSSAAFAGNTIGNSSSTWWS